MYDRILLPLDGSGVASQATEHATALAERLDIPIHLVRAVDDLVTSVQVMPGGMDFGVDYATMEQVRQADEDEARDFIDSEVKRLAATGLRVTGEVILGPSSKAIVGASQPGDVIVMASHGRSGVKRLVLGSVAEDVVRHATVPVLLVHAIEVAAP